MFDHFGDGADLIVGLGNGEPATILDAIEARGERPSGVAVHQMLPLRKRRYSAAICTATSPGCGTSFGFFAINATLEVDLLGQCASESLGNDYWSSSSVQPDFTRGTMFSEHDQSFIVLHSTADESVSRIVAQLHPGAAVTTLKNVVDCVVTEYGVAELRGTSIRERTRRLLAIALPKFRDELTRQARDMGYI
jgi:hypothetical protein